LRFFSFWKFVWRGLFNLNWSFRVFLDILIFVFILCLCFEILIFLNLGRNLLNFIIFFIDRLSLLRSFRNLTNLSLLLLNRYFLSLASLKWFLWNLLFFLRLVPMFFHKNLLIFDIFCFSKFYRFWVCRLDLTLTKHSIHLHRFNFTCLIDLFFWWTFLLLWIQHFVYSLLFLHFFRYFQYFYWFLSWYRSFLILNFIFSTI
jgi:hypothetical protein